MVYHSWWLLSTSALVRSSQDNRGHTRTLRIPLHELDARPHDKLAAFLDYLSAGTFVALWLLSWPLKLSGGITQA